MSLSLKISQVILYLLFIEIMRALIISKIFDRNKKGINHEGNNVTIHSQICQVWKWRSCISSVQAPRLLNFLKAK